MIQIYGSSKSSSGRCYLMLEELGLPYEAKPLDMMEKKEHKSAEYLKLNPNGKVPCLVDGDFVMWESMAINSYLAEKYRPEMLGKTPEEKGLVQQWSFWAITELQPPMIDILIQMVFVPEPKRDMNVVKKAQERIPPRLAVLDQALKGKEYLVGTRFGLADLNVGSVAGIAAALNMDLSQYPNIAAWLKRLNQRPSFQKIMQARAH